MNLLRIQEAARKMEGSLIQTPLIRAPWLERSPQGEIYLKLENFQHTGSFKVRGAYCKLLSLTEEERKRGIVAMSAGNHAQGVAYHAQKMGIKAKIIMPRFTPIYKVERTEALGASVTLYGDTLSEASQKAIEVQEQQNLTLIHPYDDEEIITGQGTLGLEMLAQAPYLNTLIIPIGGGGLGAGICLAAKALNPHLTIYGVQSVDCPEMSKILYPNRLYIEPSLNMAPLAEGILVKNPGILTREILKEYLDDIILVTDAYIERAISILLLQGKMIAEGAGATGVAALLARPEAFFNKKVGIVICGGNADARLLSSLLMRSLVHQGKFVCLSIQAPDIPGSLGNITKIIGDEGGNIYELVHQRHFTSITLKMAFLDVVVETRGIQHATHLISCLSNAGYPCSFKN